MSERLGGMRVEFFLPGTPIPEAIILPTLVHGAAIGIVQEGKAPPEACDALVSDRRDIRLGIRTADCAPICFSDGTSIGIAHVGWRGLCLGLIERMRERFAPATLAVYVGPFLHSFEIRKDFCYERVSEHFADFLEARPEGFIFDFKAAIASRLPEAVFDARNTATDPSLPSFRRDRTADRFVTAVAFG